MENQKLIEYFKNIRNDFPILKQKIQGHDLVYVDNSASTQKPQIVIDTIVDYYTKYNSNVHRGIHTLSEIATERYEETRTKVAKFLNARDNEIVFTKGTTDGLNLIAFGLEHEIKDGDEIVLTQMEHHSNLIPWQQIAKRKGAILKFIPITKDYTLDIEQAKRIICDKTKIVAIPHISNVLGTINPIKELVRLAHEHNALIVIDGAQSVPHLKINVKELDVDLLAFSAHKMCGPTGIGILYGKNAVLERIQPIGFGGDMIDEVSFENSTFNKIPYRFEAGTPNIEGVIAFGSTIDYLSKIGMQNIEEYEKLLTKHFMGKIKEVDGLEVFGPANYKERGAVFSFSTDGIHPHDLSVILDRKGIAIRGGHHCAMPLVTKILNKCATSRISLYFYNTIEEIDYIIEILKTAKNEFKTGKFLED